MLPFVTTGNICGTLNRKLTNVLNVARAREVLAELVEGHRHHSVCRVEGLLQCVARGGLVTPSQQRP